jgi:cytoskeleton protein RodZ
MRCCVLQNRKPRFQEASELMSAADDTQEAPALGASRVGAELRAARQRLGWKLTDVAATIRIRLPYLEAIEDGRLADLPGNAYAMGFLRSYASFLGLDAAEVARRFRAEAAEVNRKPELAFPAPVPERGVPAGAVVLMGVLIAVGAYAAWYKFSGDMPGPAPTIPSVPERLAPLADRAVPPSNPSPQVASILPAPGTGTTPTSPSVVPPPPPVPTPVPVSVTPPAPPPAPAAPPPDASRMVLRMKGDSWIQVREKNGPVLLNRVMRAGETWPVPKGQGLLLTTGNAGGTEILVDGNPTPSLGGPGAVRRDIPLDPDVATKKP